MRNYSILTPVRGLPRADRSRDPVEAGEVVALPSAKALELGVIGAVEPSDAQATVLLDWPDYSLGEIIVGDADFDRDRLIAAIKALGGVVFFVGAGLPDRAEDVLPDFSNEQLLDEMVARLEEGRIAPGHLTAIDDPDRSPPLSVQADASRDAVTPTADLAADEGAQQVADPASSTTSGHSATSDVAAGESKALSAEAVKEPEAKPAKPARKKATD